jgi:hypothetical protein
VPLADDFEKMKLVRKEFARRPLDISLLLIRVTHGVVYLDGQLKPMRGHESNLRAELDTIVKALKQRPGIRDVVHTHLVIRGG